MSKRDFERAVHDDHRFFEQHPDRQYRIRRATPAEIREREINTGKLPPLPPDWRWFMTIRNFGKGFRAVPAHPEPDERQHQRR